MLEMLYPTLLTRKAALLAVFLSLSLPLALADAAAQAPAAAPAAAAPAAAAPAAAAPPPPAAPAAPPLACLGVGAAAIPAAGPGPDPSSQGSDSLAMDRRDYIFPMGIDYDDLHRRQDLSQDSGVSMTGGPVTVPPNTTYCGYLQGLGMQTDLVTLVPGIFQLTWQNVTGDGQISINYSQGGAESSWAPQDSESPEEWPTVQSLPNDGVQYQVVYYGEYPENRVNWFISQIG